MKLKTEKKDFQSLGAESKQFSVDTSDTMVIRLLRDKMYKNKIGAVAREIASNSRDANREAGRGETPIAITIQIEKNGLLAENTLSISFKDNGIGISPERMDKIFLKYGSSTKRDTDEFTGGFGIGAKLLLHIVITFSFLLS
jgi:DNA topoisomerase VI subunit B